MKQKTAIAVAHHRESEPDDAARLITQLVRNPIALGDGFGVEQNGGDLGVGRALKPAIQRAQRQDEPVAPLGCEEAGVGSRRTPAQRTPQAERGGGADIEELVEREENRDGITDLIMSVQSQARAAQFDDLVFVGDSEN
jgi:hypothetical protein